MIERERFESWARQRWTHPEDFDQRIKAPSKYNNYEVQAAWDAWQERAAQPEPSVPDGWKLVPIEPTEEMVNAARNAPIPAVHLDSISAMADIRNKVCYRAMLTAAPKMEGE